MGSASPRLLIIRSNSGSGKSVLAQSIREARPHGVVILAQDVLCRERMHVCDDPGPLSAPYIDMSACFTLGHGLDVVLEGILLSENYGEMFALLYADHRGITCAYCYELGLVETLRRHRTKAFAVESTGEQVVSWYRSRERIDGLGGDIFEVSVTKHEALFPGNGSRWSLRFSVTEVANCTCVYRTWIGMRGKRR